ncbi:RBR-type E3 ubiquitin transferase [Ranunculus cassubicifolius]
MGSVDKDLDLAFKFQLEEVMAYSLLQPSQTEATYQRIESEMSRLRDNLTTQIQDLQIQHHDHMLARENLQTPEQKWQEYGDIIHKPSGIGASTSSSTLTTFDSEPFRLYFKGLYQYSMEGSKGSKRKLVSIVGLGAAICDPRGNSILNIEKPLVGNWKGDLVAVDDLQFIVEANALIEGLGAALSLGIRSIVFYCDSYLLFQHITIRWLTKHPTIGAVAEQISLLQQMFDFCRPIFVSRNDIRFAFELARNAIDSQITRPSASSRHTKIVKEKCSICLEDTDIGQMFSIDGCLHRYCLSCMKQHAEVKLLHGIIPRCPHEDCDTELNIQVCRKFLSTKFLNIMNERIKESSIPVTEKVYCPYPKCSVLMSKTEVLPYMNEVFKGIERTAIRKCVKCYGLFCVNCNVPWHSGWNCSEYKRLNPNPSAGDAKLKSLATTESWRQCLKCKHMIELADGCFHITCRCGFEFCYTCGAEWHNKRATCSCPIWDERNIVHE